jgi:hypothetical protein
MKDLAKITKEVDQLSKLVKCLLSLLPAATEWTPEHTIANGYKYLKNTLVFYQGAIYKALQDNSGASINDPFFWEKVSPGHLLAQEQADWLATEGPSFVRNKPFNLGGAETDPIFQAWLATNPLMPYYLASNPANYITLQDLPPFPTVPTNTSQLTNDGEDGTSPYVTADQLPSNLNLFATNVISDVPSYFKLVTSIDDPDYNTIPVDISTGAITTTDQFIASLVTSAGVLLGNPGIVNLTTVGNIRRVSGTGVAEFYYEVYHRDSGGTETLISTSSATPPINVSVYTEFIALALLNNGTFLSTDRIVVKYYGNRISGGSNPTYEFQFGGTSPVRTLFPVPASNLPILPTGLERITEGANTGWRLIGRNPANYGDIGQDAIDFSTSTTSSTTRGATGQGSFAFGLRAIASASYSIAFGTDSRAQGVESVAIGRDVRANGNNSQVFGIRNIANAYGESLFGTDIVPRTPVNGPASSDKDPTDRIFGVGNGQNNANKSTAIEIFRNGAVNFFKATLASVTNAVAGFFIFNSGDNNRPYIHNGTKWHGLQYIREVKVVAGTTYTLVEEDANKILHFTNNSDITFTIPTGLTSTNRYEGKQLGDGQLIFGTDIGVDLRVGASEVAKTAEKYSVFGLDVIGTEEYMLFGKLELA